MNPDATIQLIAGGLNLGNGTKKILYQFLGHTWTGTSTTKGSCYASDFAEVFIRREDTLEYRMRALGFRSFLIGRQPR